jgi:hypothetical protein
MSESRSEVRLGTTEALDDAKNALANFSEEVRSVVTGMDLSLRRAWHWLDREMPAYWEGQIKRIEFELTEARNSLFRKKLQIQGTDRAGGALAEKEAVRRLERQLEEARARLPQIRKWRTRLERDLDEYHARTRSLRDYAEGGMDAPIDLLNRLAAAIDAYTSTALPRGESDSSRGGTAEGTPIVNEEPQE